MPQFNKGEREDVNMFRLANTWISTDYAQKSPQSLSRRHHIFTDPTTVQPVGK